MAQKRRKEVKYWSQEPGAQTRAEDRLNHQTKDVARGSTIESYKQLATSLEVSTGGYAGGVQKRLAPMCPPACSMCVARHRRSAREHTDGAGWRHRVVLLPLRTPSL